MPRTQQQQLPQQHQPCKSAVCSILGSVDWGCLVITIVLGVATAGISARMSPALRPVFQPDATIGYRHVGEHDMPFAVALLVPFVVLVATVLAVECLCIQQNWQRRTVVLLNILLTFMAAVAVVGFMTELFKRLAGRLRPDFLSRCAEAGDMKELTAEALVNGLQQQPGCTNMDIKQLKDGHLSFPSGHSSCSMAVGLFAALYMLWTLHWREGGALQNTLMRPASSVMGRISKDVASLAVLLVLLFQIAWPWGVALSRFIDNRHNVSDVVGGLLLAVSFVPVFVVRLASSVRYQAEHGEWNRQEQQAQEQREQEQQLPQQGEGKRVQDVVIPSLLQLVPSKDAMQQQQAFALPPPGQNEVQVMIESGPAPEDSDASSAVIAGGQVVSIAAGQAVPAVADGTSSV
ncbi:phosphatidic acid phosphatase type 2/haloperoxidase [Scenedesmus sp. NREL 46B-D3]|nr:phosphatidic acid phosphatase type 2/haloperoxidase [Scenedesmus sp. NREL 46B-D3]